MILCYGSMLQKQKDPKKMKNVYKLIICPGDLKKISLTFVGKKFLAKFYLKDKRYYVISRCNIRCNTWQIGDIYVKILIRKRIQLQN